MNSELFKKYIKNILSQKHIESIEIEILSNHTFDKKWLTKKHRISDSFEYIQHLETLRTFIDRNDRLI